MKNWIKERGLPKKIIIGLIVVVIAAVAILLLLHGKQKKTDALFGRSDAYDTFIYQGTTYTLSSIIDTTQTNTIHFLSTDKEDGEYIVLPGEAVKWCEELSRFVYTDGTKARTCDINGKDRKTIYKSPDREYALVSAVSDYFAVIRKSEKLTNGASSYAGGYDVVDLISGEAFEIIIDESVRPLTISDGWLYCATSKNIRRCRLETGESEIITQTNAYLPDSGYVIDGYLYFHYDRGSVNRVAIDGGNVENLNLDLKAIGLVGHEDTVYVLCYRGGGDTERILCAYSLDRESKELVEVTSAVVDPSHSAARNIRVNEGHFVITGAGEPSLCIPLK